MLNREAKIIALELVVDLLEREIEMIEWSRTAFSDALLVQRRGFNKRDAEKVLAAMRAAKRHHEGLLDDARARHKPVEEHKAKCQDIRQGGSMDYLPECRRA